MLQRWTRLTGRHFNLRTKLLLLFVALCLFPLCLQGLVTFRHFSSTVSEKTEHFTVDIVRQINANLDRLLKDLEQLSFMPLYDQSVLDILAKYDGPMGSATWAKSDDYMKLKLFSSAQAYNKPEIHGIHLISASGILFSSVDAMAIDSVWDARQDDWFGELYGSDGEWVLIPPHSPSYYTARTFEPFVAFGRVIREPKTLKRVGYMIIDIKLDAFRSILSNLNFEKDANLIVVDDRKRLLFERNSADGRSVYGELLRHERLWQLGSNERLALDGKQYLYVQNSSAYSGLTVISLTPIEVIQKESRQIWTFTLWFAVACLAVVAALAVFLSYRITRPLIDLKKKMISVEQGEFGMRVAAFGNDEFGLLGRGFNRMMEEINRLFNEVFVLGMREKEAELAALQSQINPHFIYNTLESINMMAISRKHEEVSDMVSALGKLLRYSIDKVDRLVPLKEEIAFLASYVRIQQLRYGDRLRVVYEIDEAARELLIPKLILQPLVENALYHGIGDREQGGTVWIGAVLLAGELILAVRDDGKGLNEEEVEALNRAIAAEPSYRTWQRTDRDALGLGNIYQRIKLIYGERGDLSVDSSIGQGLAVTISIRIREKEGEDDV
ncbi:cache domain-containing sensor histidine kinase [Cohnella nanjingensis]|uniref:Sensor histidine kinase n=1 Tax=Cohnella nanjingensis TaxID=1387779 RepID=A0A7X0VHY5_9BACL|nr:sensor histidine kinase [Cohnella nanjingensis]MBB6674632.1 sensor histidine kinase [Cohnella nanjingensis]